MKAALLTAAGFTRNWGGWLASEMNTAIADRIQGDADLVKLLHSIPNFEEALSVLQSDTSAAGIARLKRLENAIAGAFNQMNKNLAEGQFDFTDERGMLHRDFSVREFLALFDAIFTLNQDMLLEKHYLHPPQNVLTTTRRWNGTDLPGTEIIHNPASYGLDDPLGVKRKPIANPRGAVLHDLIQPYYKLHGSMNWVTADGGHLLIMGGNKPSLIAKHPLLVWYAEKFEAYISQPNARLMIFGYGFLDNHINQIIERAWVTGGKTLLLFIVHPDGRESLKKANPSHEKPLYVPGVLDEIPIRECRRNFREIIKTSDTNSRDILWNFAAGK